MKKNLKILLQHFPSLDRRRLVVNTDGLEHDLYIYDNNRIFKFSKTAPFLPYLDNEIRVLEYVQPFIDLQLPHYDIVRPQFASYKMISGTPLSNYLLQTLPGHDQRRILRRIGEFLHDLHTIPFFQEDDLPPALPQRNLQEWDLLFEEAEVIIFPDSPTHIRQWIADIKAWFNGHRSEFADKKIKRCLIHGDLGLYHILLNGPCDDVQGILDFGVAGIGDPAVDLAAIISQLGESRLEAIRPHYPGLDALLLRAKLWSLSLPIWWALQGIKSNDHSWFLAGLTSARDIKLD